MTDEDENEPELHARAVGGIVTNDGDRASVDHVYTMENDDNGTPEPGQVGLIVHSEGTTASILMTPDDALVLANRLVRAANLVMEAREDVPDPDREYRRHNPDADT